MADKSKDSFYEKLRSQIATLEDQLLNKYQKDHHDYQLIYRKREHYMTVLEWYKKEVEFSMDRDSYRETFTSSIKIV
jgi:DNA replication initiation complex subunit (GINS family)